jgi:hypothetical protein
VSDYHFIVQPPVLDETFLIPSVHIVNKSLSELPLGVCHSFGKLRTASEAKPKNLAIAQSFSLATQMLHFVQHDKCQGTVILIGSKPNYP